MKKWLLLVLIISVLLYVPVKKRIIALIYYDELENKSPMFTDDSTALQQTVILPAFDTPVVPGKNNIWCSSFQLAWNEMKENVINEPVVVIGAEELSQRLNTAAQTKKDLAHDSYYANAGMVSDGIIDVIQKEMAARFPDHQTPVFDPSNALIAYAYLESYIKFTTPFRNYEERLIFTDSNGSTTPLKSFGVWKGYLRKYKPLCKQIEVLYCTLDDNYEVVEYALDLCKDTQPYQIVIASVNLKGSLEETFDDLQVKIDTFKDDPRYGYLSQFDEVDILQVPDMFWKITHHFAELEGKPLANQDFEGLPVSALQIISFRLDRSGVILESEAMVEAAAVPREFILNQPFFIYLKKRDAAQPFFAMWVDNAELLTPFDDTDR